MKTWPLLCCALLAAVPGGWKEVGAAEVTTLPGDAEHIDATVLSRRPAISFGVVRSNWRLHLGDDARWAQPGWDDSQWDRLGSMYDTPARQGIFWLRFRVQAPNPANRPPTGAWISGVIAYELYWDGVLLVRNGVPGNRPEEEVPGHLDVVSTFPESLTGPGTHVVAMRVSSYRGGYPGPKSPFIFFMNDPVVVQAWEMRNAVFPTLAAGAMFILAVVCALIWFFAVRRPALLYVGLLSLCAATAQALVSLRWFYNYPSDWSYRLEAAQNYIHGVLAWCFAAFVVTHFAVPYRRWLLTTLTALLALYYGFTFGRNDHQAAEVIIGAYGVAAVPLLWAARRHRPGAWPIILGVAASATWILTDPWMYAWTGFFPRFLPALLGVTAAISLQIRVERREAQQARLTAARMEIELLKKSLQPHFLMNTLTALMEVIEQSPAGAVDLIDDLAGEFRLLNAMSAEKTVPLAREIELCQAHLRVMSVRKGQTCRLEAAGIDPTKPVPPALLLTLIENGFSHQRPAVDPVVFQLTGTDLRGGRMRYTFISPGAIQRNGTRPPGGTGLRYIKARLEESSPGGWTFAQQETAAGWATVIEIGPPSSGPCA